MNNNNYQLNRANEEKNCKLIGKLSDNRLNSIKFSSIFNYFM